jgi:NAD(P)-dependent dehydrogenase (short-subunit alcohol dehydrogenase family)
VIDLGGRVALVTGASAGIGGQIARAFGAAGAAVVVHARREDARVHRVLAEIAAAGGRAVLATGDLADEAACADLVEQSVRALGRLDVLVNNAGVQPVQALDAMTLADWRAVVDVNLGATFACTQFAARQMRGAGGGSIIHIASIEGSQPAYGHAHYAASKAAIIMHARAAAIEYGPLGIRVNTVSPGLIARPGLEEDWPEGVGRWLAAAPLGRLGTGMDVANACLFLASPMASWITGHNLVVDGGMSAHPAW